QTWALPISGRGRPRPDPGPRPASFRNPYTTLFRSEVSLRVRTISRWSRALLPAVALAALPLHLPAQPAQLPTGAELAAAIDSIAAERLREGPIAGFSVAVSRGGELLVARSEEHTSE